jgi:hypothetical protein
MKIEKVTVTNLLFQNDEQIIKKGLLKLKGVVEVIIKPENNLIEVKHEHIESDKITNRLYALGYLQDNAESNLLMQICIPIALPQ